MIATNGRFVNTLHCQTLDSLLRVLDKSMQHSIHFDVHCMMQMKTMHRAVVPIFFLLLFSSLVSSQEAVQRRALDSLVASERAFARLSLERGIRESFLTFFSEHCIVFQPHPVEYKEMVKDKPAQQNPKKVTLDWEPIFADVAEFGDLGYTTGPSTLTDNSLDRRPPQHGFFFSVWKRQRDGLWKVVLDVGTSTHEAYAGSKQLRTAKQVVRDTVIFGRDLDRERKGLLDIERSFLRSVQAKGILPGYSEFLSSDARLHRQSVQPILGLDSIKVLLSSLPDQLSWNPIYSDVSHSVDLGYVYGSYEYRNRTLKEAEEQGYYARVWKRDLQNKWKIVMEVNIPLPRE